MPIAVGAGRCMPIAAEASSMAMAAPGVTRTIAVITITSGATPIMVRIAGMATTVGIAVTAITVGIPVFATIVVGMANTGAGGGGHNPTVAPRAVVSGGNAPPRRGAPKVFATLERCRQ